MKKSAVLLIAGAAVLAGCQNEVMTNRQYRPAPGSEIPAPMMEVEPQRTPGATLPVTQEEPVSATPGTDAVTPPTYAPMVYTGKATTGIISDTKTVAPGGTYVVKAGDTAGKIALAHRVKLADLMRANNLTDKSARRIRVGQKLIIPGGKTVKSTGAATAAASTRSDAAATAAGGIYVVRAGDTIGKIAYAHRIKSADLMRANNLNEQSARRLQIGQKLVMPGAAAPTETTAAPTAVTDPVTTPVTDSLDAELDQATTVTVTPESGTATTVVTTDTAVTVPADNMVSVADSVMVEVEADVSIEDFARQNNVTVDELRRANADVKSDSFKKGDLVFVPKK